MASTKKTTTTENNILAKIANFSKIFELCPQHFNFKKLTLDDKFKLISLNGQLYSQYIGMLTPDEKACGILYNHGISRFIKLEQDEVEKMLDKNLLYQLLLHDFKKYGSLDIYNKLSSSQKRNIYIKYPDWALKNVKPFPTFTNIDLWLLSESKPSLIEHIVEDFSKISVKWEFWKNMVSFDKKYEDILLENLNTLATKTDIRSLFCWCPGLIKKLNMDIIEKSKLTSKEWLLLIKNVINNKESQFKNWKFSPDLIEFFRQDLTLEILTGESKNSTHLKNAMVRVFE